MSSKLDYSDDDDAPPPPPPPINHIHECSLQTIWKSNNNNNDNDHPIDCNMIPVDISDITDTSASSDSDIYDITATSASSSDSSGSSSSDSMDICIISSEDPAINDNNNMNMSVDSPEEVIQRAERQRAAREVEMQQTATTASASRSIIREESASARSMQFVVDGGTQASSSSLSAPPSNNNIRTTTTTATYSISSESESSLLNDNKPSMQCAEHKLPSNSERERERSVPQRNLLNIRGMKIIDPLRISNTSSNTSGSSIDNNDNNMNVQRWCSAFYNGVQQQQQPQPPLRRRSASMGGEEWQPAILTPPRRRSCESRRSSRAYDNNMAHSSSFVSATSYIGCEPVESVWGCYNNNPTIGGLDASRRSNIEQHCQNNGLDELSPPSRRRLSLFEVPVGLDLSRRNSIETSSTSPYLNRMMMNVQAHLSEATYNAGPLYASSIGDNSRYTFNDSGPSGITGILDQHASMNNWAAYSNSSSSPGTTTEEEEEGGGLTTTTTDHNCRPEMMMMDDDEVEEEEEEEDGSDYLDDDLSAEHYRRRSSYDSTSLRQQQNILPHLATMKEEEEEENVHEQDDEDKGNEDEGEDMSQALVVRKVTGLDPEEASFAEKERAMEYTHTEEGQSLVLHDNTPATHQKKKKRKSSTSKSPRVLAHHSQQQPPIDTSTRYNGYQHCFITIQEEHRFLMLYTFLKRNATRQNGHQKIIIFFSTTKSTQYYSRLLSKLKFNVRAVHNGMTRERFLQHYSDFVRDIPRTKSLLKSNENGEEEEEECAGSSSSSILCIPDFQGNDIAIPPSTNWLVQFEPPNNPSEYIFRVGRISSESKSSRINNKDVKEPPRALLFVTPQQFGFFKYYKAANVKIYEYEIPSIFKGVQKKITKIVHQEDVTGHHKLQLSKLGADAYHAYLCAYAGHDYKDIYNVKDLDVKKVALCFGFDVPPFNNMEKKEEEEDGNEELGKIKKRWTPKKKKKSTWTTTRRGGSNDKNQADAEGADKKKKKGKVSPAKSRANREHNQWKPSKYEPNQWKPSKETLQGSSGWMPKGTKKSWRASRVHADKMKVDKQKSGREIVDEFKPKVVKLPRAS